MLSIVKFIILALATVGLAIGISFVFRWVRRYGAYAYATARVNAMKRSMFRKERLTPLVQSTDLMNLMSTLKESPYSPYLEEVEEVNPPQLERALRLHQGDVYEKVARLTPEEIQEIFHVMLERFDVWNLKTIFTCQYVGIPSERVKDRVLPYGLISPEVYERAIEADGITEATATLEETKYWDLVSEATREFEETGNVLPLQFALEKSYWTGLWKKIRATEAKYTEVVQEAIGMKIDVKNIMLALRCKTEGVSSEDIKRYMIPIHFALDEQSIERMLTAENVRESVMALEGTLYGSILTNALAEYEETGSLFTLERALDEFLLRRIRTLSIQYYVGIGPSLAFLHEKDVEVKNLITIINGKVEGLGSEELRKMLIVPEA